MLEVAMNLGARARGDIMINTCVSVACVAAVLCLGGCAAGGTASSAPEDVGQNSVALKLDNEGTALSESAAVGACSNGLGTVTGTLTTTGSVDSADVTISLINGPVVNAFTVQPQDFVHDGRIKTFSIDFQFLSGLYSFEVCATQSGSQGRTQKAICEVITFRVSCD
jgi:hypothetical protein